MHKFTIPMISLKFKSLNYSIQNGRFCEEKMAQ